MSYWIKMAAGTLHSLPYPLKETDLAMLILMSPSNQPGEMRLLPYIMKIGISPGLETGCKSDVLTITESLEFWHWIIESLICRLDLLKVYETCMVSSKVLCYNQQT